MSQDIKESPKQASLHATSKPARTSTIRGADPNAKSRVLDPGTAATPDTAAEFAKISTVQVHLEFPVALYNVVAAWGKAQGWSVEETFLRYAQEIETATKLGELGNSPTDEPPAP
jgi:hypothetical protein